MAKYRVNCDRQGSVTSAKITFSEGCNFEWRHDGVAVVEFAYMDGLASIRRGRVTVDGDEAVKLQDGLGGPTFLALIRSIEAGGMPKPKIKKWGSRAVEPFEGTVNIYEEEYLNLELQWRDFITSKAALADAMLSRRPIHPHYLSDFARRAGVD